MVSETWDYTTRALLFFQGVSFELCQERHAQSGPALTARRRTLERRPRLCQRWSQFASIRGWMSMTEREVTYIQYSMDTQDPSTSTPYAQSSINVATRRQTVSQENNWKTNSLESRWSRWLALDNVELMVWSSAPRTRWLEDWLDTTTTTTTKV